MANAWGVLAVSKFAKSHESGSVTGKTTATLDGKTDTLDWSKYKVDESGTVAESRNTGLARQKAVQHTMKFDWPKESNSAESLIVEHSGTGKPWASFTSFAALPRTSPLSNGYRVEKSYTAIEQKSKGQWSKGDVIRIHLDLEADTDMTWVVVDDPIPAGTSIFGTGLGRDSKISAQGEKQKGDVWPAFEERSFEAYRAYFEFVPKGKWSIEYTIRLNQSGRMGLPPTRVEAMYSPEMFAEYPNETREIAD